LKTSEKERKEGWRKENIYTHEKGREGERERGREGWERGREGERERGREWETFIKYDSRQTYVTFDCKIKFEFTVAIRQNKTPLQREKTEVFFAIFKN
jgi:hypothetical protein